MWKLSVIALVIISLSSSLSSTAEREDKYKHLYKTLLDPEEPLILTPLIEENKLEVATNLSRVIHEDFAGVKSFSGFLTVNKQFNSNLFFWYFPAEADYKNAPVLLWLQGGPGASSLFGLFVENGPFKIIDKDKISLRNESWHKQHSLLFVDNPAGTGFSFTSKGGYCTNQIQVGEQLFEFLQQFFTLFPDLQTKDFIITGESYAGKYIPALGHTILKNKSTSKLKFNLKGLAIGDGLTDPIHQETKYADYLYHIGLIDIHAKKTMEDKQTQLVSYIQAEKWLEASSLRRDMINEFMNISGIHDRYNYLYAKDPTSILDHYLSHYLNRTDVKAAIHVGKLPYDSGEVAVNLEVDKMKSVAPWVSEVLSSFRVLLYVGQLDILDGYPLVLNYLQHLNFSGADEYKTAKRRLWFVDESLAGYTKQAGNLTEVLVRNAGHMVPFDQPKWAYDLIYRFARNIPFK